MRERDEFPIVDHARKEGLILASAFRFPGKKKILLADGGGAESIRLDHVGAGFEILRVNFLDHIGAGELEQLEIALEALRGMLGEALPAELFLR